MANATTANATKQPEKELPIAQQKVRVKYIGDLRTGPAQVYGVKLVPEQEYEFPFYIAELCAKEKSLFKVVDRSPLGEQLREMIAPRRVEE